MDLMLKEKLYVNVKETIHEIEEDDQPDNKKRMKNHDNPAMWKENTNCIFIGKASSLVANFFKPKNSSYRENGLVLGYVNDKGVFY